MKKRFCAFLLVLFIAVPLVFSGCFGGGVGDLHINNDTDLVISSPGEGQSSDAQYYTSKKLQLVTSINGSFKVGRSFTLDENDSNKRVYDDIYLYEEDYFKMDVADSPKIFYQIRNIHS